MTGEETCDQVAAELEARGVAPAAAAGFSSRRGGEWQRAVGGRAGLFYDLASLTKPIFAVAFARSGITREMPLGGLLEEARGTPSEETPVELLLAHRAGLASHLPLFAPLLLGGAVDVPAALREAACARREDAPALPAAPVYSDLGYLLAGAALARTRQETDASGAMRDLVIDPLGLGAVLGCARDLEAQGIDLVRRAAPTEIAPWRGGEVRGRVHDENAWAIAAEGACGHAGLFGKIGAVLRFAEAVLDAVAGRSSPLAGDLAWLVRDRPGGTLRAGFDGKSAEGSSAGTVLGPRSFGHLGFTGTSFWIDPDAEVIAAVLTNRVHPTRENVAIREARPRAHDALARAALAVA